MADRPTNDKATTPDSPPTKKPYRAPALLEWGTLRDITQTVGVSGASDGGKSKTSNRTH